MLSIKARSIDVAGRPQEVYRSQVGVLEGAGLKMIQLVSLEPYEGDHAMAIAESA
jgi:fibrillarin-like rRNA methylase